MVEMIKVIDIIIIIMTTKKNNIQIFKFEVKFTNFRNNCMVKKGPTN